MYDNRETSGIDISKMQSRKPWTLFFPNKQKDSATTHGQILLVRTPEMN